MEVAVVAGRVTGKLGQQFRGVDEFAVAEGVPESYRAVVGVRCRGLRVGGLFEMADGLEFAVVAPGVADELFAVLAGEEDFIG